MAMIATGATEEEMAEAVAATRAQIGFYASTPAYRPVLEMHGWGDLQPELRRLSKAGEWAAMGDAIDDEMVRTLAVVAEPDGVVARAGRAVRRRGRPGGALGPGPGVPCGGAVDRSRRIRRLTWENDRYATRWAAGGETARWSSGCWATSRWSSTARPSTWVVPSRARCSPCCWWPRDGSFRPSRSSRPCGATTRPTRRPARSRATCPGCGALVPGGARGEAAKVLAWDPPGYKLMVAADALDTRRFEALAERGRTALLAGDAAGARELLEEALGLWRGAALLEFSHLDFAWGYAARLEERRLVATEDRIDADLRLGRHAAVVGELGELVAANPLASSSGTTWPSPSTGPAARPKPCASSTTPAARLRNQLGIDPGRPLVELESAILAQDPALTLDPAASPARAAAAHVAAARGGAAPSDPAATRRRPRWSGARSSCGRPSPPWTRRARRRGSCWSRASRASARPACSRS